MKPHEQHLQLLSIFHYVAAAIGAFFSCFPFIHLLIGLFMLTAPESMFEGEVPPRAAMTLFGLMFTVIPLLIILSGWTVAAMTAYAGRCLAKRRAYTYCLVVAVMLCFFMPIGTVLGVLTLIVLNKPEVKSEFETGRSPFGSEVV